MSYSESPTMHIPLGLSSWKKVWARGDDLINRCLYMGTNEGGSVVIEDCMPPSLLPLLANLVSLRIEKLT